MPSAIEHTRSRQPGAVDAGARPSAEPLGIPDLALWLAADRITGIANGTALGAWPDSSGNGRDATQATAGLQPIYNTNQVNGLPAVAFDGSNDTMATGWTVSSGTLTVAVVLRTSHTTGFHRALGGTNNWLLSNYSANYQYYNSSFIAGPAVVAGGWAYLLATQKTGEGMFYCNGVGQGWNTNSTLPGTVHLSRDEMFGGDIAEVIGYSRVLTQTEIATLHDYIRGKYALT